MKKYSDLQKIVFITGVSRGIGRSICIKLLNEGYKVIGTFKKSKSQAYKLKKKYKSLTLYQVDFRCRNQTLKFIKRLRKHNFYAIINNAGIFELEDFTNYKMKTWDDTFEVNLNAVLLFSTQLNIKKGGSIVNIASTDGLIGSFSSMAYCASKASLINLTKSLANNYGSKGIRVNSISPGWINTGMSTEESFEASKLTPLGRNGKPKEVGDLVSFLISKNASFINGANIVIDGGYSNVDFIMKKEAIGIKN